MVFEAKQIIGFHIFVSGKKQKKKEMNPKVLY